jgi:hypothetical protein
MTCKDCGHAVSMNEICEKPIQAATDMLKHMAAHNASRAFATVGRVIRPEVEAVGSIESACDTAVPLDRTERRITELSPLPPDGGLSGFSLDQLRLSETLSPM